MAVKVKVAAKGVASGSFSLVGSCLEGVGSNDFPMRHGGFIKRLLYIDG